MLHNAGGGVIMVGDGINDTPYYLNPKSLLQAAGSSWWAMASTTRLRWPPQTWASPSPRRRVMLPAPLLTSSCCQVSTSAHTVFQARDVVNTQLLPLLSTLVSFKIFLYLLCAGHFEGILQSGCDACRRRRLSVAIPAGRGPSHTRRAAAGVHVQNSQQQQQVFPSDAS